MWPPIRSPQDRGSVDYAQCKKSQMRAHGHTVGKGMHLCGILRLRWLQWVLRLRMDSVVSSGADVALRVSGASCMKWLPPMVGGLQMQRAGHATRVAGLTDAGGSTPERVANEECSKGRMYEVSDSKHCIAPQCYCFGENTGLVEV